MDRSSAIAGVFHRDGHPVGHADFDKMLGALVHHGGDGAERWSQGFVALGRQFLRPTGDRTRLESVSVDDGLVITADARLDNRRELVRALNLRQPGDDISDSELILEAYRRWDERCPERLLGDFAFAIWDSRRQSLFCARDQFGVKALYYALTPNTFAFATEIKALLRLGAVPRRLNEERVADFLLWQYADRESTFYVGVSRLLPAHYLVVDRDREARGQYWSLDPSREIGLGSDRDYAEGLREHFVEAVRCRMESPFRVGSMLSGGIDSSSITCVAQKLRTEAGDASSWPTFSIRHDVVPEAGESAYIDAVLDQGGYEPHVFQADSVGPLNAIEDAMEYQDEVFPGANLYLNRGISDLARQQGVRVLLDGFDGDTTVSHGFGYFQELARADRWIALAREVIPFAQTVGEPWARAYWSWIWSYKLKARFDHSPALRPLRPFVDRLNRGTPTPQIETWVEVVNPDFATRVNLEERRRSLGNAVVSTERQMHFARLTDIGETVTLEALGRAAAARGVEVRFPFFDRRLVEYCLALPPEQKIRHGWTRWVMRGAMEGILPHEIQWRRAKTVASAGFEHGLRMFDRARVEAVLHRPRIVEDYVHVPTLQRYYARFLAKQSTQPEVNSLWIVVSLALWLQHTDLKLAVASSTE